MDILVLTAATLLLSYISNKLLVKWFGEFAVMIGAPIVEEAAKTFPAYWIDRPIFHVHLLFGLGEAVYDFLASPRDKTGPWAALLSLLSHALFGIAAMLAFSYTHNIIAAFITGLLIHCGWNTYVMIRGKNRKS
jgi:hypothetical protein